jgi:hypothetical protein
MPARTSTRVRCIRSVRGAHSAGATGARSLVEDKLDPPPMTKMTSSHFRFRFVTARAHQVVKGVENTPHTRPMARPVNTLTARHVLAISEAFEAKASRCILGRGSACASSTPSNSKTLPIHLSAPLADASSQHTRSEWRRVAVEVGPALLASL